MPRTNLRNLKDNAMTRFYNAPIVVLLFACLAAPGTAVGEGAEAAVNFNQDIRPILWNRCLKCHGPDNNQLQAGLRLDTREGALAAADSGSAAVVPGKPGESELLRRVTSADASERMPPAETGPALSAREVASLTSWIGQGAPYAAHWSYVKPVRPELPDLAALVRDAKLPPRSDATPSPTDASQLAAWPRNAVDQFILARLLREGLVPSPEADRYALIRRAALDLTGLPPTLEEVDQFVGDPDPQAYERLVDRLLAKETYGEHWARMWLDLARYADSSGYADDPPRTIWAYRDWVIRALNANQPFDQFTVDQLAGDLLPDPTSDQLLATAFHRNTLTNNEGGTNDEEFRNVAVADRVNTTMAVWMGTTINCAQCHSHKYDPISQEEYFKFFAVFNNTEDADRREESPLLDVYTAEQRQQQAAWQTEIKELEQALVNLTPEQAGPQRERLEQLKKQLAEIKPITTVPIQRELPADRHRKTYVQHRGNFLDPGQEVTPGVPAAFHPLPAAGTPPAAGGPDPAAAAPACNRLDLARWLVDDANPLTARVIVNRYWEALFGRGIVPTSEEFGSQGDLPTHPELLDWLATELVRLDWDTKALVRLLVTSATYRQSSRVTAELSERDPGNLLLARGPRFRLSAEMVRDQALAVSGLLSSKMYGPPVQPSQPTLGLSAAFGSGVDWQTSQGEDRYRRAVYTMWRRSSPYPSLATFDAPNREVCTVRRDRTNTPLQALVTLNDPVYVEAAQALARRLNAAGATPEDKARHGFRLCLARPPSDAELQQLVELYQQTRPRFTAAAEQAKRLATVPLGAPPDGADVADLAAWTVVGNVLLNLDEMLMKR